MRRRNVEMQFHFEHASLRVSGLRLENGLLIDEVYLEGDHGTYDAAAHSFSLFSQAHLTARLDRESLAAFVRQNPPSGIQDVQVSLLPGQVRVTGRLQGFLPLTAEAVGHLVIADERAIAFHLDTIRVAGVGAPESLLEKILESINPLLDLSALPFPVKLQNIEVTSEAIRLEATAGPIVIQPETT